MHHETKRNRHAADNAATATDRRIKTAPSPSGGFSVPGHAGRQLADDAGAAAGGDEHQCDQQHAINGTGGGLADLVGDVGDEFHKNRPEDRADDAGATADDEADADDAEGLTHLDDLEFGYAKRDIDVLVDGEAAPSRATVYLLEDGETLATLWAGLASGAFFCVPSGDWGQVGQ